MKTKIKDCELCHKEEAVVIIMKKNKFYEVREIMEEVPNQHKDTNVYSGDFGTYIPNTLIVSNSGEEVNYIHVGNKCLKLAIKIFDLLDKPFQVDVGSILRVNNKK